MQCHVGVVLPCVGAGHCLCIVEIAIECRPCSSVAKCRAENRLSDFIVMDSLLGNDGGGFLVLVDS